MTNDYYIKQRLILCENKLNLLLYKNPRFLNCPRKVTIIPFFQEYAHIPAGKKS